MWPNAVSHGLRLGARVPRRCAASGVLGVAPLLRRAAATSSGLSQEPHFPDPRPGDTVSPPVAPSRPRRNSLRDARPFSDFLTDTFSRQHDYLRISLTERCNLRCVYCMPEEGVPLSPDRELLTTPEVVLLSSVFVSQGVTKIRLTGGEPTLCLTTNGISLHRKLEAMVEAGLTGVNLSLDTLDPWQYQIMTRRNGLDAVRRSIDRILELNRAGAGVKLKINCVVMRGLNDAEIVRFVDMTRDADVEVRFIEYMPFDGNRWSEGKMFGYREMLDRIREAHPGLHRVAGHKNDTSKTFQVPGFRGRVGFITSMTQNFCGSCNRLRITSDGNLKVCLFGEAEVSLRDILRKTNAGEPIDDAALERMQRQLLHAADTAPDATSQQPITVPNSQELLDLIGMAVKRKKAKHAGIGELEHMKNRPMILIDTNSLEHRHEHPTWPSPRIATGRRAIASRSHGIPWQLLPASNAATGTFQRRLFSTYGRRLLKHQKDKDASPAAAIEPSSNNNSQPKLTHVTASGAAHMVSIASKAVTTRIATAACTVVFSSPTAVRLILENQMGKGDVLGVARVAGIMAAKRTPDLIPLCHPVAVSHVSVELDAVTGRDRVEVRATVGCDGKTGVEMEALTAAATAALTVYDMCKAVDKGMRVDGLRVVLKDGGRSGRWVEGMPTTGDDDDKEGV
ncbi:hypothetical protein MAPG_07926 [Magnaporthiopsis poae ATCC 64411]|uniref:Radical SAM core domain-containing protein n=1 Tax=Magnaporthiopsis poae (strain ATCC 64411 / 73-15) TaxID=644358 RepID=A0A0C4E5Z7_MAGP6|nr:hypothetical protein MAPG_07926 [Magnaporthiopsis poae ATCC 64411]